MMSLQGLGQFGKLFLVVVFALHGHNSKNSALSTRVGLDSHASSQEIEGWALSMTGYTQKLLSHGPVSTEKTVPPSFHPPSIEFDQQPLCKPREELVVIVNNDPKISLKLYGISSKSSEIHCTWFELEELEPGQNTSFTVVLLGNSIGRFEAGLVLSTSFGEISYQVFASSVLSSMRARPLSSGRVPVGVTYSQPLSVYNPLDTALHVLEIYTSNDLLQLEPAVALNAAGHASKDDWVIEPRESKTVMHLRTRGRTPGNIQGYVHVRTNMTEADVVISVRTEISPDQGLFHGPGDSLDFGALAMSDAPKTLDIVILSNTDEQLRITSAKVDQCTNLFGIATGCPNITIELKRMNGLMEPKQWIRIGEATLTPSRDQPDGYFGGLIAVEYINLQEEQTLQLNVPFFVHILKGSLRFPYLQTAFYTEESPLEIQNRTMTIENDFEAGVKITSIELVGDDVAESFWIADFTPHVISANSSSHFVVSFLPPSVDAAIVEGSIIVSTNASNQPFVLPLYSYDGSLKYLIGDDNLDYIDFGQINLGENYSTSLQVVNPNPIPIKITYVSTELQSIMLSIDGTAPLPSYHKLVSYGRSRPDVVAAETTKKKVPKGAKELSIFLLPGHAVLFTVSIEALVKSKVSGELHFGTLYEVLHIPVSYHAHKHSMAIVPKTIMFQPTFPGQLVNASLRKASRVKHLIPLEEHLITMSPKERLDDISNIYSDDPRLIIERVNEVSEGQTVTLAKVSLDAAMGPWLDNYTPQIYSTDNELGPLTADMLLELQRAHNAWRQLVKRKRTKISSKIFIESTNTKTDLIDVKANLIELKLGLPESVSFPLTQIRHVSREVVTVTNPSQYPVLMGIETFRNYSTEPDVVNTLIDLFSISEIDSAENGNESRATIAASFDSEDGSAGTKLAMLEPYGTRTLSLIFRPLSAGSSSSTIFLRNNLTAIQALPVMGEAGRGTFGFPKSQPYIVDGGLLFPLSSQNLSYCRLTRRLSEADAMRSFNFNVTVVNRGNMPVTVQSMGVGDRGTCESSGFTIINCGSFVLRPKRPRQLSITFRPDFTSSILKQTLVVILEGLDRPLNFNMETRLPHDSVKACYDALPGPKWEAKFKGSIIMTVLSIGAVVFANEYARGTWQFMSKRKQSTTKSSKSSSKSDKSAAVVNNSSDGGDIGVGVSTTMAMTHPKEASVIPETSGKRKKKQVSSSGHAQAEAMRDHKKTSDVLKASAASLATTTSSRSKSKKDGKDKLSNSASNNGSSVTSSTSSAPTSMPSTTVTTPNTSDARKAKGVVTTSTAQSKSNMNGNGNSNSNKNTRGSKTSKINPASTSQSVPVSPAVARKGRNSTPPATRRAATTDVAPNPTPLTATTTATTITATSTSTSSLSSTSVSSKPTLISASSSTGVRTGSNHYGTTITTTAAAALKKEHSVLPLPSPSIDIKVKRVAQMPKVERAAAMIAEAQARALALTAANKAKYGINTNTNTTNTNVPSSSPLHSIPNSLTGATTTARTTLPHSTNTNNNNNNNALASSNPLFTQPLPPVTTLLGDLSSSTSASASASTSSKNLSQLPTSMSDSLWDQRDGRAGNTNTNMGLLPFSSPLDTNDWNNLLDSSSNVLGQSSLIGGFPTNLPTTTTNSGSSHNNNNNNNNNNNINSNNNSNNNTNNNNNNTTTTNSNNNDTARATGGALLRRPPGLGSPPTLGGVPSTALPPPPHFLPPLEGWSSNGKNEDVFSGIDDNGGQSSLDSLSSQFPSPSNPNSSPTMPGNGNSHGPPGLHNSNSTSAAGNDRWTGAYDQIQGAQDAFSMGTSTTNEQGDNTSSLPNLPSIPYAADNIWGSSGSFGDLDWAKTETKKMNPGASEWNSPW